MKLSEFGKVTTILRGYTYEEVALICRALVQTKYLKNIEITLNSKSAIDIIYKINQEFGSQLNVGAGTVLDLEAGIEALRAGASFLLSPTVMDEALIGYCKDKEVVTVSGAYSPTEIYDAKQRGADIVKVFPIISLGASYIKDIKAPLGDIPIMAVGGVDITNGKELLNNGVDYLGLGNIVQREKVCAMDYHSVLKSCLNFESQVCN